MGDVSLMWGGPAVTGMPQQLVTPEAGDVEGSAAAVTGMPQQPVTPATVVVEGSTLVEPRAAKGHTGAVC